MIVLRWAAIAVFLICLLIGAEGVRDWLLAAIALAAFLTVCWTLRGTDRPPPVSPHYANTHRTTAGGDPPQPPPAVPNH